MNFDNLSDEDLALFIQSNNGNGIEQVIERYQKPLLRYAKRLIIDSDIAEDIVQNTFISVYQNINSYDPRRPFSPWIYRIAHNKAINEIRKRKNNVNLETVMEIPDDTTPSDLTGKLDKIKLKKKLKMLVNQLPLKYKEIIILRFFEDQTYEEISDILRIPKNTVGVRIKRGLAKLKLNTDENLRDYL